MVVENIPAMNCYQIHPFMKSKIKCPVCKDTGLKKYKGQPLVLCPNKACDAKPSAMQARLMAAQTRAFTRPFFLASEKYDIYQTIADMIVQVEVQSPYHVGQCAKRILKVINAKNPKRKSI